MRFLLAFLTVLATASTSAHAEWRAYETAHFVFYSQSGAKDVSELARKLESVDGLMRLATHLGDTDPVKVRIYEVADERAVQAAMGEEGTGVAGFYTSNVLGPYAVVPRRVTFTGDPIVRDIVIHHEYAHHFMLQYFPASYPRWYTEGFAELIGSSRIMPDGKIAYGYPAKHRGDAIAFHWVPLQRLLTVPMDEIKQIDLYGQGWALTHFLTFSPTRAPQLRQFLQSLNRGSTAVEAAKSFGDLDQLNREALNYLRQGTLDYRPVAVPLQQPLINGTRALSAAEADLIPETIAFSDEDTATIRKAEDRAREQARQQAILAQIRTKAGRYPTDSFALRLLAEAEAAAGNYAAAEAAADRLLALNAENVPALVVKSRAMSRAAQRLAGPARITMAAKARELAVKANRLDNNEPLALVAFYESYKAQGTKPPPSAVDGLSAAVATLARNAQIRQMLVDELEAEHRYAAAITVLAPIANSAHKSPRRDAAQAQLARLKAAMGNAPAPAATGG